MIKTITSYFRLRRTIQPSYPRLIDPIRGIYGDRHCYCCRDKDRIYAI
ncbi:MULTISPECIES: hypothetical protein [unclassified Synechocystis]|nr:MULTISPECIES: hypothetical protein [unclassified Synechocystis]AIE73804.1 hypothetical protein D082_12760 [Synechocystis sp. PCC 6714]MCT0252374.1 hypothetical protein [Synechocystis sp. CS-94]